MSNNTTPEAVNAEINETLALLDTEYEIDASLRRNVVLFIGITGTGKSTLCQFLAGNPKLKAKRDGPTSDIYITDGNEKVSESTTESKTLFPELVPIPNTETVLADCPGFSDTRSAKHDIAAAVFTKQLLDEAEQVKIMVATVHHAVRKGVDRKGFTDLLAHVVHFVKDIDKYKDSIGLLVTKVENQTVEDDDGNFILIPDNVVISEIGSFLSAIRKELMTKQSSESVTKQIQLLDVFIAKNDSGEYSKIGIFRRPSKIEDLNINKRMQKNKKAINNILNNALQSIRVAKNDFGLSLSADSKYIVTKMRETLNTNLSNILDDYIRVYTQKPLDSAAGNTASMKTAVIRSITIGQLLDSAMNPNMVVTTLMDRIQALDPEHAAQQYANWKKQQTFIQFLKSIAPTNEDTTDFTKYHSRISDFKDKMSSNVKLMGHNAEKNIDQEIGKVVAEVMAAVKTEAINLKLSTLGSYKKLSDKIESVYNSGRQFKANNESKPNLSFADFLSSMKASFTISEKHRQEFETIRADVEFFKTKITTTFADGHQEKWLQGFSVQLNELQRVAEWYSFVADSYDKMIEYDSQNVITAKTNNLKNWSDFKVLRKQLGTNANLNRFLESRPTISSKEQIDLNNLVDSIQSSVEYSCESSKLVVKDNLVKLRTIKTDFFPKCAQFSELYIFAKQTVFIDDSLLQSGKNVYIIAPRWEIKGRNVISLQGLDAIPNNGYHQDKAGNPGRPGGSFVGIAAQFVNGNDLTINVSGGNGGNGVDGGNGSSGTDGKTPNVPGDTSFHTIGSHDYCNTNLEHINGYSMVQFGSNPRNHKITLHGTKATRGTPGGNGGKPGYGGQQGSIEINTHVVNKIKNNGKVGIGGAGGKGGLGGQHGRNRDVMCYHHTRALGFEFKHKYRHDSFHDTGRAENGADGVSGAAGNSVEAANPRSFVAPSSVAGQYKQYIQQKESYFVDSLEFINRYVSHSRKRRSLSAIHATPVIDNWKPQQLVIGDRFENVGAQPGNFSDLSLLALADVLIRKLIKTKPTYVGAEADPDWKQLLIQAEVLKIVEKCEAKWEKLIQTQPQRTTFDPLCLQKELTKRVGQLVDKSQGQKIEQEVLNQMYA